jgi:hypothetical protein
LGTERRANPRFRSPSTERNNLERKTIYNYHILWRWEGHVTMV